MKLDNTSLKEFLKEKGITSLYHANTLGTTVTYIEQGGLLSRGAVENKRLKQTPQSSDEIDKKMNVWNDIFLDTVDLHNHFHRQNYYGPIMFKISTDFIDKGDFEIWITKNNPIYWNENTAERDKYFGDVNELRINWDRYRTERKMLTIRHIHEPILFEYVENVIVDDPQMKLIKKDSGNDLIFFDEMVFGIKEALKTSSTLSGKFKVRECLNCYCRQNYLNIPSKDSIKLFLPFG